MSMSGGSGGTWETQGAFLEEGESHVAMGLI